MGFLFVLLVERFAESPVMRAGLLIGLLGGFTTFSSFSIETFNLLEQGELARAAINVIGSVVVCLCATWVGVILGRQL
jgi:CrcB protein